MHENKWYVVGVTVIDQYGNVFAMCDSLERADLIAYEHNKAVELLSENGELWKRNVELNDQLKQAQGRIAELEKSHRWGYGPMDAEGNYPDELQYYEPHQDKD